MATADFTTTFITDKSPMQVFDAINDIKGWWSKDFKGTSHAVNDEFEVRFEDLHYSRHKLTEVVPGEKIVWLVTDSNLSFLKDKTEWNGTTNIFTITPQDGKTAVTFTHHGLVPEIECFSDCSNGWNYFVQGSLQSFINTGTGVPHQPGKKPLEAA